MPDGEVFPVPSDEAARLNALRRYDAYGTPPEKSFDRITRLAAQRFGVPIALINLVGEEDVWHKSCVGFDARSSDRGTAFCAHAIMQRELLVVEDLSQDARFAQNPLVTGAPHLRFYAGAPLRSSEGHGLGTLCLIGEEPRAFSAEERRALSDLAALVSDELELRVEVRRRKESEARYREVVSGVRDVVFRTDNEGRWTFLSTAWEDLLGYGVEESLGRLFTAFMHPDERAAVRGHQVVPTLCRGLTGEELPLNQRRPRETYEELKGRFLTKAGEVRWMRTRVRHRFGEDGAYAGSMGTMSDTTDSVRYHAERAARRQAEEVLKLRTALLDNLNHELRTPLTSIIGMAEVIDEELRNGSGFSAGDPGSARQEEAGLAALQALGFTRDIVTSARRLQRTLESVMELSQVQGAPAGDALGKDAVGKDALAAAPVSRISLSEPAQRDRVIAAVRGALYAHRRVAEAKGVTLNLCTSRLPEQGALRFGTRVLHQVTDHLVSNAVKFTDEGAVDVVLEAGPGQATSSGEAVSSSGFGASEVERRARPGRVPGSSWGLPPDSAALLLSVRDTGIGMSEAFLRDALFKAFRQESEGLSRTHCGIGVGLAIVKEVVEQVGGGIDVCSTRGDGTCVTVAFPLQEGSGELGQEPAL